MSMQGTRGRWTARRITAAARALFARQGYAGTSLGEVAFGAGVSVGTLQRWFGTKGELFRQVLDDALGPVERLTAELAGDLELAGRSRRAEEAATETLRAVADHFFTAPDAARLALRTLAAPEDLPRGFRIPEGSFLLRAEAGPPEPRAAWARMAAHRAVFATALAVVVADRLDAPLDMELAVSLALPVAAATPAVLAPREVLA